MMRVYAILFFIQVLFGINFVTSKYVLEHVDSWVFVFVRFSVAGLFLMALLVFFPRLRGGHALILNKRDFLIALGLGFLGFSFSQTLFLQGLKMTSATNTAILSTTIPLLTLLVSVFRGQRSLNGPSVLGFGLAFFGVLVLKDLGLGSFERGAWTGDLVVLFGCLSIAFFLSFSKDFFSRVPSLLGTAYLFLFGAIFLIPFSLRSHFWDWTSVLWDLYFILSLAFSIFVATVLTYFLSHWILRRVASDYLALFIFFQPLVAAGFGWALLDEQLTWRMPAALILVCSGVALVTLKEGFQGKAYG